MLVSGVQQHDSVIHTHESILQHDIYYNLKLPFNHLEINPEYSLEGMMLKLKIQYSGHLIQRADSLEKTLMLRKIEGKRRRR